MGRLKEVFSFDNYKKHSFIINAIILTILFFAHCFSEYVAYVVFPLLLAMIVFDDIKNGLSYVFFSVPLCFVDITINLIFFCVCVFSFFIKYAIYRYIIKKEKVDKPLLILFSIFVVYCFCPFGSYSIMILLKLVMVCLLFALIFFLTKDPQIINIKFNVKVLTISLFISVIFSLTYYISPFVNSYLGIRDSGRFGALFKNVNPLAMCCELAASVLLFYILSGKYKNNDLITFFLLAVLGSLTNSKTFLILITLMSLAILVYFFIKDTKKAIIASICIILIIGIIVFFDKGFVKGYFLRFLDNKTEFESIGEFLSALTTARYDLWLVYINEMICYPFIAIFGTGLGSSPLPPNNLSPHSFYISSVYQLGIVGSLLFCSIIAYMVIKYYKVNKIKPTAAIFVSCGVWVFLSLVEDLIFYMY